mgnify:CR=1 FL=1
MFGVSRRRREPKRREGDRMSIRPVTPGDLQALKALYEQQEAWTWCGDDLSETGPNALPPEALAFVDVENGEILAYTPFRLGGTFGYSSCVTRLVVHKEARGRGVERRILEFVEEIALARDQDLFLLCRSDNPEARRFCEEMGYEACGELEAYPGPGVAQVIYRKRALKCSLGA